MNKLEEKFYHALAPVDQGTLIKLIEHVTEKPYALPDDDYLTDATRKEAAKILAIIYAEDEPPTPPAVEARATPRGGHGFDIMLKNTDDTPQVYWTYKDGVPYNSYVSDGTYTYSINGIGEIRWRVERWNPEYEETRRYFGLEEKK